ncbi:peptidase A24 [Cronobacter condimenti 1330]|uniref:Peptidase A24 n=1 Tax=Cronobacter condimenti 1330 TaxID=1073999 RepID=A0ABN4IEA0_9ENTR|nr:A24 family peptidase [Cronobacter condimenti]ALB64830.1 peptidase A24 [Cronobacter condimenti 1330]
MDVLWIFGYVVLNGWLVWKDVRYGLLPDRFTCPLLWLGLSYHLIVQPHYLADAVAGAMAGYLALCFIYWAYRGFRGYEGLGYGDIKFFSALGAWHGWQMLGLLLIAASLLGLVASLCLYLLNRRRYQQKTPLPFGPFLAAAGLMCSSVTFQV